MHFFTFLEFDKAAAESGELEKQVSDITSQITAITGGRMEAAQQKLNKVTKRLEKVSTEIPKLTVAIKTSRRYLFINIVLPWMDNIYILNIMSNINSYCSKREPLLML